jgi:hypothetical protein
MTGNARDIADAQILPDEGFNLNIPYLHEVNTTQSNNHCSRALLPPTSPVVGDTLIFDNDKANDNYYQLNC